MGGVSALSAATGLTSLLSAAACCALPLAFAAAGLGVGGLAAFVPYHWPLTIVAGLVVVVGWALYFWRRRLCLKDASCAALPPSRATALLLILATLFVALSAIWPLVIERPLMRLLGGA